MLSLIASTLFLVPVAAPEMDAASVIEGSGTVIIGGDSCQLVALDDGRFVVLQEGALPNAQLEPKTRIRITAHPAPVPRCKHADLVVVDRLQLLIDTRGVE